ncbi:hypothetical protein ONS95_007991 [Cadophora gregata]|uniref:uncharacterized protein n=1 Tax=Cadophora gregata TaxID=51156 RepID=UPI0026DBE808|nr:uncharacterized protein ONS95_007991 [Cadophora gregata]KAK0119129.1 hypothetical protein ONS96_012196 [Cadophora gregata f. sp. sojae]KAK0126385.1 hypothetical protein ONS95_007991 [Cadophora gregata]
MNKMMLFHLACPGLEVVLMTKFNLQPVHPTFLEFISSAVFEPPLCLLLQSLSAMACDIACLVAGVTFLLIAFLFLMTTRRSSQDRSNSKPIGRPAPDSKAVVRTFASRKIKASPDEVYSAMIDYKSYPKWSSFAIYEWEDTSEASVPPVGSKGNFKVLVDEVTRNVPIRLNILDIKNRLITEESISYPAWLLKSERIQKVVPLDGEPVFCEYRTQHNLFGLASYYLLLTSRGDLEDLQTQYAGELKCYIESQNLFKDSKR